MIFHFHLVDREKRKNGEKIYSWKIDQYQYRINNEIAKGSVILSDFRSISSNSTETYEWYAIHVGIWLELAFNSQFMIIIIIQY